MTAPSSERRVGETNNTKKRIRKELFKLRRVLEADRRGDIGSDVEFYKRTEHHMSVLHRLLGVL